MVKHLTYRELLEKVYDVEVAGWGDFNPKEYYSDYLKLLYAGYVEWTLGTPFLTEKGFNCVRYQLPIEI